MIEILQFIFSSFWVWAGTMFLAAMVVGPVVGAFASLIAGPRCRCKSCKDEAE